LTALRRWGIRLEIDDFGTGYSSLSYLSRLPIDTLKIDRSFIRDMSSGPNNADIVKGIAEMAHSLRLKVIAEGVETEEQFCKLRELHCDYIQGFLLSRPLSASVAEDLLGDHLKNGQTLSVQKRPTRFAEDVIVLPCRRVRSQSAD
jgi:EAL domain-containing protein (putative c-di-GMP-specific phosphodiesterase class I)